MSADPIRVEWRPVPGQEGRYEVSDQGRVRSLPRWRVPRARLLKASLSQRGYLRVQVRAGGRNSKVFVLDIHRTVCRVFHGEPPFPGAEARHLDGNKLDNRAANLAWGSKSDNMQDAVRHGTHPHARKTHCPRGHELGAPDPKTGRRRCPTCRRTVDTPRAVAARRERVAAGPVLCSDCGNPYSPNAVRRHRIRKHGLAA